MISRDHVQEIARVLIRVLNKTFVISIENLVIKPEIVHTGVSGIKAQIRETIRPAGSSGNQRR